jgi:hypothetical protein
MNDTKECNWERFYPSPLLEIRALISPDRLIIYHDNQPQISDEKCVIMKWTDAEGDHIVRFLKLPRTDTEFEEIKLYRILYNNN